MSSISQANYDAKKYLCVPHDGSKGVVFRHWCDNFLTVIAVIDLKDPHQNYELAEAAIGHDDNGNWTPHGAAGPIAAPAPGSADGRPSLAEPSV